MATTDEKSRLSRKYVYAPLADLGTIDLDTAAVKRIAFIANATDEPTEPDWNDALIVTLSTNPNLYRAEIGEALAALVGPLQSGETGITTKDLATGQYMVWTDWTIPGSDERNIEWHGPITVKTAAGTF
jgi:hypothetical protein